MIKESRETKKMKGKLLVAANVLLILGLGAFGGYYFKKYQDLKKNPPSVDQIARQQTEAVVSKVSKLYGLLPTNETPTIFEVNDEAEARKQSALANANKGDQVLVYPKAKLVILYRPSIDKLINVSSVTIQSSQPRIRIIGEETVRSDVEKTLKEKFANDATISSMGEAKGTHDSIIVVDLTGQQAEVAQKLATGLGGRVGELPEGEEKPADTDILIIAGS